MRRVQWNHCVLGSALCVAEVACGGSGASPTSPQCSETVLLEGGAPLAANSFYTDPITVNSAGRVDIVLDWDIAGSRIGLYMTPSGTCPIASFNARTCTFLIRSEDGSKPRRVSASNIAAGRYDVHTVNSAEQSQVATIRVSLKSETCPPL